MQNISQSTVALPTDLNLTPKAQAVVANSKRINITPLNNTTWNPGDSIMWDFPVNRSCTYLNGAETSLMIRVKNNDASTMWVDHSAVSFIQRIDLYSSGQLLETIDNYGVLYSALLDCQTGPMDRCTYNNLLMGTDNADIQNNSINISRGGVPIATGATATFYIPIISGIIGSALGRYLPICDIAELKVVVTLAPVALPAIYNTATPTAWTITASEFVITTVQLDPGVDRMLHESHGGGPIVLSTETWRNFNTILAQGGSSDTILIPIKPISAKSLLCTYRPSANLTNYLTQSVSGRVNPFSNVPAGSSFQLLCGSTYIPQKPIVNGSPELFMETFKTFHGLGNVNSKTLISASNYEMMTVPNALTAGSVTQPLYNTYVQNTGSFVAGVNLDIFSGQSTKSMSGLNMSIGNSFIIQSYKSGTPLGVQTRFDGFLHYDQLILIDPASKQISFKM